MPRPPSIPIGLDSSQPIWLQQIRRKQARIINRHEKARILFNEAYTNFLADIDEINMEYGTEFTAESAIREFIDEN